MTADTIVALWTLAGIAAIGGLVALLRVVWAAWQFRQLRREHPDAAEFDAIDRYLGPEVVKLGTERHEVKR